MQTLEHEPLMPGEQETLAKIARMLSGDAPIFVSTGNEGEAIELPRAVAQVLSQVVHQMARNRAVFLTGLGPILTTQEAADILGVSRPYLIKLLEEGEIPFTTVGTHRRVHIQDVLQYKARRKKERKEGLRELAEISQELGLYD